MGSNVSPTYGRNFFDEQRTGSSNSARIVVPLVVSLFRPRSVVDFGCGVGTWLAEFRRQGVTDMLGVDGDYVQRDMLEIPPDCFRPVDLTRPVFFGRRFDLACCLEVAEHLPESAAATLVDSISKAAGAVVFSAAIPGQGGTDHINLQWQDYWVDLFRRHAYEPIDLIRPRVWGDDRVAYWYQQNIVVFCQPHLLPETAKTLPRPRSFNIVHPAMYEAAAAMVPPAQRAAFDAYIRLRRGVGRVLTAIPGGNAIKAMLDGSGRR